MGPSSSTKTIPSFVISYVKHQHSMGVVPTRDDVKNSLKKAWEATPWQFGFSNDKMTPADWESSVYPTFRSMYARAKNSSGGQKGLEDLTVITNDGIDKIFHTKTWLKYCAGANFKQIEEDTEEVKGRTHTFLENCICEIGKNAGYKLYLPNKDKNEKMHDNLTIHEKYSEFIVNSFEGMNNLTKEIDVIFIDVVDGRNIPIKAFEVENSTSVVKGIVRLKSLDVDGTIVSTKKSYKKIFDDSMENAFSDLKEKIKYVDSKQILKYHKNLLSESTPKEMLKLREDIDSKI